MGERISLFWRFQLTGWAIFIAVTFPLKIMLAGSVTGALMLCAVRDGSSFLLTLGIRQIYRKFWSNEIGRMVALIVVTCAVAGLLQNGFVVLFRSFVSSEAEFHLTHSKAFDVFYERTGLLFGWSFLYFGIRHAIEGIQRELIKQLRKIDCPRSISKIEDSHTKSPQKRPPTSSSGAPASWLPFLGCERGPCQAHRVRNGIRLSTLRRERRDSHSGIVIEPIFYPLRLPLHLPPGCYPA